MFKTESLNDSRILKVTISDEVTNSLRQVAECLKKVESKTLQTTDDANELVKILDRQKAILDNITDQFVKPGKDNLLFIISIIDSVIAQIKQWQLEHC